ncbi:hypothetical protein C8T65DRAFT_532033, partial [Cerioporus squamosus]
DASRDLGPCSLQFLDEGKALVVSYVYDGIICWSTDNLGMLWRLSPAGKLTARLAISPDQKSLITHNLLNGFDRYRIDHLVHAQTYLILSEAGVTLPVCIIQDGKAMLLGSTLGKAHVIDVDDGRVLQTLSHPGTFLQAHAAGKSVIATGSSNHGLDTVIGIWSTRTGMH